MTERRKFGIGLFSKEKFAMGLFSKDKPMDQKLKLAMKTLGKADQPLLGALSEIDQGEPYEALPCSKASRGKHSEKSAVMARVTVSLRHS